MPTRTPAPARALCAALLAAALAPAAHAQEQRQDALEQTPVRPWSLNAIWENDGAFVRPDGPDKHYSNGAAIVFEHQPRWSDALADALNLPYDDTAAGYVIGHQIFTPDNLFNNPPDPNDRPYAGYLYGGAYWQRVHENSLDHVEINLGLVGPSALAEDIQKWIHDTFLGDDPQGWDAQLPDEPTFQAFYRKKWRYDLNPAARDRDGVLWQVIPTAGVALGTVYRHAEAGATLRFGQRMPNDFGAVRINDLATGAAATLDDQFGQSWTPGMPRWSWSVFGRANVKLVEHNMLIEGSEFQDSAGVDAEPLVGALGGGVQLRYRVNQRWSLDGTYAQTLVTEQFDAQNGWNGYATLGLALRARW